jgi:hypothetical protein
VDPGLGARVVGGLQTGFMQQGLVGSCAKTQKLGTSVYCWHLRLKKQQQHNKYCAKTLQKTILPSL